MKAYPELCHLSHFLPRYVAGTQLMKSRVNVYLPCLPCIFEDLIKRMYESIMKSDVKRGKHGKTVMGPVQNGCHQPDEPVN